MQNFPVNLTVRSVSTRHAPGLVERQIANIKGTSVAHFEPIPDLSILSLEGQTSLQPIHTSTNKLEGSFDIALSEPGKFDLSVPPNCNFEIYVSDLKSNAPYLDRVVQERMDMRRFPHIRAAITNLQEKGENIYAAVGQLTFHGVTAREEGELFIKWLDDTTIEVKGEIVIDVRNYGIDPPRLVAITNDPQVRARLKLVLRWVDAQEEGET